MNKRIIAFISAVAVLFTLFAGTSAFAADESAPVIDGAYDEALEADAHTGAMQPLTYEKTAHGVTFTVTIAPGEGRFWLLS